MARGEDNATYAAIQRALERGAVALQADADLERTLRGFDLRPRPPEDVLAGMAVAGLTPIGRMLDAIDPAGTDLDWTAVAAAAAPSSGFSFPASLAQVQAALGIQTTAGAFPPFVPNLIHTQTTPGTPVAGARAAAARDWGVGDRARVRSARHPEIDGRICVVEDVELGFSGINTLITRLEVNCLGKGREHLTATLPASALEEVAEGVQAAFIPGDRVKVTLATDERCGEAGTIVADWESDPDTTGVWVHLDAEPQGTNLAYHPDWLDRLHEEPPEAPATAEPAAAPARATLVVRYADGEERRTTGSAGEIAAARAALATVPGVTWEEVAG